MKSLEDRKFVLMAIFVVFGLIFILRLFYVQVIDDSYALSAENQALRYVTVYPDRGVIYDRNGKLLVYEESAYDLMVIPRDIEDLDTTAFCDLLGMEKDVLVKKLKRAKKRSSYAPSHFEKQITKDEWARIAPHIKHFPGFYPVKRTLRNYPQGIAAHVLGYLNEVDSSDIKKDAYYKAGDYIGKSGLEKMYEKDLRGEKGLSIFIRDVHNKIQGSYKDGANDTMAITGTNLYSTLDADLQAYGEQLMQNKEGSIVAIEPSTGEILALVTSPTYDPNLLVGRSKSKHVRTMQENDSLRQLFNRALHSPYRPGSIFKLVQGLIALEEGVIVPETRIRCNRGLIGCHGAHSNDDLFNAIKHSCNPYFRDVYRRLIQPGVKRSIFEDSELGLKNWRRHVMSFGLGVKYDTDLPGMKSGMVPSDSLYDKWYGDRRWAFSTIYSNSIGEGELIVHPIQMANLAAVLANRGYYYTPHLIKGVGTIGNKPEKYTKKNYTTVDAKHYDVVIDAMQAVVDEVGGTARRARIDSVTVCGKTGTIDKSKLDLPDHSVFIAFAPRENPKIAIAVYVQYSGYGGTWAAPISSLMMEKYIKGSIKDPEKEKRILEASFLIKKD